MACLSCGGFHRNGKLEADAVTNILTIVESMLKGRLVISLRALGYMQVFILTERSIVIYIQPLSSMDYCVQCAMGFVRAANMLNLL